MTVRNSEYIDPERGEYSVLGLVAFQLGGPYWWHCEDINEDIARGSVFRAYEPDIVDRGEVDVASMDLASITVVDVTNDPSEPDVSELEQADIPSLDEFLRQEMLTGLAADGMELIDKMSSRLNQSGDFKGLVSPYTVRDNGKLRQYIALRIKAKGRKVVIVGVFDLAKKEVLSAPIFNVIRNMVVLA